jgi:hypothetical protein
MSTAPDPTETGPSGGTDDDHGGNADVAALKSEAARRRKETRAAEAERDAARAERDELRQCMDDRNRADVETLAAELFADPSDVWAVTSLEQMQNDEGLIDPDKAGVELQRVLAEKPHWKKPAPVAYPEVHQGAMRGTVEEPKVSFGDSIRRAVRGG